MKKLLKYGLVLNKPVLMFRVLKNIAMAKLGFCPLKYVDVAYDYRCNKDCKFCFAKGILKGGDRMTVEEHREFCEQAMRLGAYHFDFQGGEPLMNFDGLEKIVGAYHPQKNFLSITTNGILLNKQNVRCMLGIGIDLVVLSWDKGFEEKLDILEAVGMNYIVNFVVSRESLYSEDFYKLCELSEERNFMINCLFAVPVGGWEGEDVLLTEEDKQYFVKLQNKFSYLRRDIEANFGGHGCGAAKEAIYLTAYGDVFACPFIHKSFGNIRSEYLEDIRDKMLEVPCLSDYYPVCMVAEDREVLEREDLIA